MPNEQIEIDWDYVREQRKQDRVYSKIAGDLGIHPNTLRNACVRVGFEEPLTVIDDEGLAAFILNFYDPAMDRHAQGETQIKAALTMEGWGVTWDRLRHALRLVDPEGVAERSKLRKQRPSRTLYDMYQPNSLWHMDQNEKCLKKGGWYVFGIVDGGTRRILQFTVADHKFPWIVVHGLKHAMENYGVPWELRMDNGTENVYASDFMNRLRGHQGGGALHGVSVSNIKIEHQWLFTRWNVLDRYRTAYDSFCDRDHGYMPMQARLQTTEQKYVYKYLVMPRFKDDMDLYQVQWNTHKSKAFSPWASPNDKALEMRHDAMPDLSMEEKQAAFQQWMAEDVPGYPPDEYAAVGQAEDPRVIRPLYDNPFVDIDEQLFFEHHVGPLSLADDMYNDLQARWVYAFNVLGYIYAQRDAAAAEENEA